MYREGMVPQKKPQLHAVWKQIQNWNNLCHKRFQTSFGILIPQNDAEPNFYPDSKSSKLGLSNVVSFVSEFDWDGKMFFWKLTAKFQSHTTVKIRHHGIKEKK